MKYILKYSPEITIKSRSVRTRLSRKLGQNLRALLARLPLRTQVEVHWDYVEVDVEGAEELRAEIERILSRSSGIYSWEPVRRYPLGDLDSIVAHTLRHYRQALQDRTFAVRCKRAGHHDFSSMDIERQVGAALLRESGARGVNLSQPEVLVQLEIRHDRLFVAEGQPQRGLGGFPGGSQDGVLSLLSGGFDSAVASYMAIRRGLTTHYLFFNLGGAAHEVAVKEVALYLWMTFGSSQRVRFVSVPFEDVVAQILEKVDNSQMGVVLKRMMLRAAGRIARELNLNGIVTGESVAQVSSQTLANLAVIDKVSDVLVLRPLIMSDKQDIIDLARQIGTEEFSAVIPEYCGVISVKPTTRAREERIAREEANFDFAVLDQAIAARRIEVIDQMQARDNASAAAVDVLDQVPPGAVVLDIRHPDEEELKPLDLGGQPIEKLPFFRLNTRFPALDPDTRYLLYCGKGIMSRLHAAHLRDQGHANVAVFLPAKEQAQA